MRCKKCDKSYMRRQLWHSTILWKCRSCNHQILRSTPEAIEREPTTEELDERFDEAQGQGALE